MEKKSFISFVAKAFIFSTLLTIFVTFYMKDQLKDFFEGRTTTSSKFIEVEEYQIPTMIFCMNPGTKTGVATDKYNLTAFYDVFSSNESFSQVFEDISYILSKDYDISIGDQAINIGKNQLKIGERNIDIEVNMIRTMHHGTWNMLQTTICNSIL